MAGAFEIGATLGDLIGGGPGRRADGAYVDQINKNAVAAGNWQEAVAKRALNTARATITPDIVAAYQRGDASAAATLGTALLTGNSTMSLGNLGGLATPGYTQAAKARMEAIGLGDTPGPVDAARYNQLTAFQEGKEYQPFRIDNGNIIPNGSSSLGDVTLAPSAAAAQMKLETDATGRLYQIAPNGTGRAVSFDGAPLGSLAPVTGGGAGVLEDAVRWVESRGNPNAVSPKGALGSMQTMPNTLRDPGYGVAPARDNSPAEMERVGRDYLGAMQREFGLEGGLAAYNWGPGNWQAALTRNGGDVRRALEGAPRETRAYVPAVLNRVGGSTGAISGTLGDAAPRFPVKSDERDETFGQPEEVLDPATGKTRLVRFGNRGGQRIVDGYSPKPAKDDGGGRPLPAATVNRLTGNADKLTNLNGLISNFTDDYAGNTITGGLENTLGRYGLWGGDEQQAEWWQQYDRYKNVIRNELFGASLTPGEERAFKAADIGPEMDPSVVRTNLTSQSAILNGALARQGRVWLAQGYNRDAIEAAIGVPLDGAAPATPPAAGAPLSRAEQDELARLRARYGRK